ncbi:hypothetical protein G9F32_13565 [Acinetobacter sp. 194]|uniref:hypothetical protein n=1 Tax=Acinetobacter shaoyimingii TaxID=2715164 RepID=UPI00140AFE7A|nr:hypothetical protein [Acinetobacter shaoyimingii]NHB59038.1 hypothetical protein [Acinetobacter shaoyimingii]
MKLIFLLSFIVFLAGCHINKIEQSEEKKIPNIRSLYKIKDKYFESYTYIEDDSYKISTNHNASFAIKILNNKFTDNDINILEKKLVNDGWKKIDNKKKFQYCYGRNVFLELIPPLENLNSYDGYILLPVKDYWNIGFSWRGKGEEYCENYETKSLSF